MTAVAVQNPRVKDPVYHIVLTWPSLETPTDAEAFSCGTHALASVGMTEHQYVSAVHRDTANVHLHIAVNRVHPDTFVAVYPDRDYFKLDRAMRELEVRHRWQHDNGPYAVFQRNGRDVIDWRRQDPNSKEKKPAAAADMERHGAQESLFSYARGEPRKELLAVMKNPQLSWQQLHRVLAKYDLEFREKGQGFAIFSLSSPQTTPIKASDLHETLSKGRLTKRLGTFQPAVPETTPAPLIRYDKQREPRRDPLQRENRRQQRAQARRELRERYAQYKNAFVYRRLRADDVRARYLAIKSDARRQRGEIRTTVTDPIARKILYSVIAFETLRDRDRLRRTIQIEREALRSDPTNHRQTYREWVEHQASSGDSAAISQLRGWAYREKRDAKMVSNLNDTLVNGIRHDEPLDPVAQALTDPFYFRVCRDGSVIYKMKGREGGFVDHGQQIEVMADGGDDQAPVAAALRFAKEKFGGAFVLTGSDAFKRRAIDLMIEHKIEVRLKDASQELFRRKRAADAKNDGKHTVPRPTRRF